MCVKPCTLSRYNSAQKQLTHTSVSGFPTALGALFVVVAKKIDIIQPRGAQRHKGRAPRGDYDADRTSREDECKTLHDAARPRPLAGAAERAKRENPRKIR